MTQSKLTVALILSGVLGGVVGAAATAAISARGDTPTARKEPVDDAADEAGASTQAGDEAVNDRIRRLEGELRTLQRSTKNNRALEEYSDALKKQRKANPDGEGDEDLAPVVDGEDPTFELAVRTVMDRVEWEKQEERKVNENREREERAERQTELLAERLGLSTAQRPKLQSILVEQMDAFRSLRRGENGVTRPATRTEWREQVDKIRTETEKRLGEVLNDEQMTQYKEWVAEEGWGRARGARGGRGNDNR